MTMFDDGVRKRIESELERVNREVVALKTEPRPEELEGLGDTSSVTEEFDAISYTEIEELRSDRLGRLLDRAAALDEALHRIDEGTYAVCVACGNRILEDAMVYVLEKYFEGFALRIVRNPQQVDRFRLDLIAQRGRK